MRSFLKTLRIPPGTPVDFTTAYAAPSRSASIETYLTLLIKQNYLDKVKVQTAIPSATQQPASNKRGRTSKGGDGDGDSSFIWKWGSRALAEIGETKVADFVASFMLERPVVLESSEEDEGEDDANEEGEASGSTRTKARTNDAATMKKSIAKAAGGPFRD